MSHAVTAIHRHVHKAKYILQSYCIHKRHRWATPWGSLVHFTEQEFMTDGLHAVLGDLDKFAERDSDVGSEDSGTTKEAKRARGILSECWMVYVSRQPNGLLQLDPMLDLGKGRAMGCGHKFLVALPTTPDHFFATTNAAFDQCCVVGS